MIYTHVAYIGPTCLFVFTPLNSRCWYYLATGLGCILKYYEIGFYAEK